MHVCKLLSNQLISRVSALFITSFPVSTPQLFFQQVTEWENGNEAAVLS